MHWTVMLSTSEEGGTQHLAVSRAHVVPCGLPLINVKGEESSWNATNAALCVSLKNIQKATSYCHNHYTACNQTLQHSTWFLFCRTLAFVAFWDRYITCRQCLSSAGSFYLNHTWITYKMKKDCPAICHRWCISLHVSALQKCLRKFTSPPPAETAAPDTYCD